MQEPHIATARDTINAQVQQETDNAFLQHNSAQKQSTQHINLPELPMTTIVKEEVSDKQVYATSDLRQVESDSEVQCVDISDDELEDYPKKKVDHTASRSLKMEPNSDRPLVDNSSEQEKEEDKLDMINMDVENSPGLLIESERQQDNFSEKYSEPLPSPTVSPESSKFDSGSTRPRRGSPKPEPRAPGFIHTGKREKINVGENFQAAVPPIEECLTSKRDSKSIEVMIAKKMEWNDIGSQHIWNPRRISNKNLNEYIDSLNKYWTMRKGEPMNIGALERSMRILSSENYDVDKALTSITSQGILNLCLGEKVPWMQSEKDAFQHGILIFQRDFAKIQALFLPHRDIHELVLYYYQYYKTELMKQKKETRAFAIYDDGEPRGKRMDSIGTTCDEMSDTIKWMAKFPLDGFAPVRRVTGELCRLRDQRAEALKRKALRMKK